MNNPTRYTDPSGYQQVEQYEDSDSSPWSIFDQMAQMERRLGISNGGIGGSSFGRGFGGYSYSDAYIEARSQSSRIYNHYLLAQKCGLVGGIYF